MAIQIRDIAWLAGLLEGEGCFSVQKGSSVTIQLSMTDADTIDRAAKLLGGERVIVQHRTVPHYKMQFRCSIAGNRAAGWMMTLYPLMSARRQSKIKECLDLWKSRKPRYQENTNCLHKDRPHQGRGMCKHCYQADWYHRRKEARQDAA